MVLRLRIPAPNWRYAKCKGSVGINTPDPFFEDETVALDICNGIKDGEVCPLRQECLLFALTNNCSTGVYGGMGKLDRLALRKLWPLRRGVRHNNRTVYEPRPEWHWMPPGEPVKLVDPVVLEEEDEDDDD